jgi:glycosyltransferase involved in cell wall biosynthesis
MKKVLFLMGQNDLGGHTRFVVNLISELQKSNVRCVMYVPVFSHYYYTTNILTDGKSLKRLARFFIGHLVRSRMLLKSRAQAKLMFGSEKIKIKRYFLSPSRHVLDNFDITFTSAHWQVNELAKEGFFDRTKLIHILHHVHSEKSEDIETYFMDRSLRVIVSSGATLTACEKLNIAVTEMIPLGVRTDSDFINSFKRSKSGLNSLETSPVITFFFYNHLRKNPSLIHETIVKLLNETSYNIVVVGNGFESTAKNKRLSVFENITDKEYFQKISESTLFVYISRFEGFGLPPLEAMSFGVATMASRVGAVPEYGRDLENILINPVEIDSGALTRRIVASLADLSVLKKVAESGRESAKDYSIARTADRYLKFING